MAIAQKLFYNFKKPITKKPHQFSKDKFIRPTGGFNKFSKEKFTRPTNRFNKFSKDKFIRPKRESNKFYKGKFTRPPNWVNKFSKEKFTRPASRFNKFSKDKFIRPAGAFSKFSKGKFTRQTGGFNKFGKFSKGGLRRSRFGVKRSHVKTPLAPGKLYARLVRRRFRRADPQFFKYAWRRFAARRKPYRAFTKKGFVSRFRKTRGFVRRRKIKKPNPLKIIRFTRHKYAFKSATTRKKGRARLRRFFKSFPWGFRGKKVAVFSLLRLTSRGRVKVKFSRNRKKLMRLSNRQAKRLRYLRQRKKWMRWNYQHDRYVRFRAPLMDPAVWRRLSPEKKHRYKKRIFAIAMRYNCFIPPRRYRRRFWWSSRKARSHTRRFFRKPPRKKIKAPQSRRNKKIKAPQSRRHKKKLRLKKRLLTARLSRAIGKNRLKPKLRRALIKRAKKRIKKLRRKLSRASFKKTGRRRLIRVSRTRVLPSLYRGFSSGFTARGYSRRGVLTPRFNYFKALLEQNINRVSAARLKKKIIFKQYQRKYNPFVGLVSWRIRKHIIEKLPRRRKKAAVVAKKRYMKIVVKHRLGWYCNLKARRSKLFRKRLRRWIKRYRRIKKNKAFGMLLRSHFFLLTGMH